MEPVGLVVGVAGLAGLFSTCLDVIERFEDYKSFEPESRSLLAQFETHKIRFQEWGSTVGIENGKLLAKHNKRLDDPKIKSVVEELLWAINTVCELDDNKPRALQPTGERTSQNSQSSLENKSMRDQIWPKSQNGSKPQEGGSRRKKFGWAFKDKNKRINQVDQFSKLVENIYDLVPPAETKGTDKQKQAGGEYGLEKEEGQDKEDDKGDSVEDSDEGLPVYSQRKWAKEVRKINEEYLKRETNGWLLGNTSLNGLFEISVGKRADGTCDWIFNQEWFQIWASAEFPSKTAKILWINGPAGFGKSILCARVIEHMISSSKAPVAHFFFSSDFESRRDPFVAIKAWLSELLSNDVAFSLARDKEGNSLGQNASRAEILAIFCAVVERIPFCTFIIDGLDECGWTGDGEKADENFSVTNFLETVQRIISGTSTRILIVSRDEAEIRHCICGNDEGINSYQHRIRPEDVRSDTEVYSRSIVDKKLGNRSDSTKEEIALKLADRCNGQFLWVKMQEDSLRRGKSQQKIEQIINSTPVALEQAYERNWIKISQLPDEDRQRATSLLRWTAFALRPLTIKELSSALLVDDECDEVRLDDLPDSIDDDYIDTEILDLCGALLEIRSPGDESPADLRTVHLAHFSIKQYLLAKIPTLGRDLQVNASLGISAEIGQSHLLAKMCLCYINCEQVWVEESTSKNNGTLTAFRDYAAGSWQRHASNGSQKDEVFTELVSQLFDPSNGIWSSWKKWFDNNDSEGGNGNCIAEDDSSDSSSTKEKEENSEKSSTTPGSSTPSDDGDNEEDEANLGNQLYYASWLGLVDTVNTLILHGTHEINQQGNRGRTPLIAACFKGDTKIAEALLENGADVNIADVDGNVPLTVASLNGHVEIVKMLVKNGASIGTTNDEGGSALNYAACKGHFEIVKLLVSKGAEIQALDAHDWSPLHGACDGGHLNIVKFLVEEGAELEASDDFGRVPVYLASVKGHTEIVRLLLENGADPSCGLQYNGWTPLSVAADNGHFEIVKALLERGADHEMREMTRRTPLYCAAERGYVRIVKMLIEHGANIEDKIVDGLSVLYVAALNGRTEVVKILLAQGANPDSLRDTGWSPLNASSENGYLEVVKLLVESGADIELVNDYQMSPLYTASKCGRLEVVKYLLAKGANPSKANKARWTPVCVAAYNGYPEIVRILLEADADYETSVEESMIGPLYGASYRGHTEIVKLLLEKGADCTKPNKGGWTPINVAASNGHTEIVKILLEKVPKDRLDDVDDKGWTPVNAASDKGHVGIVRALLEAGADYDTRNIVASATALYCASLHGYTEIVKLLLDKGADFSKANKGGWTPINVAASNGFKEVVELLLQYVPKEHLAITDDKGWTPVNAAADKGHIEIVRMLLEAGADFQTPNIVAAATPLYCASYHGFTEIVKNLLDKGADYDKPNQNGWTPVNVASSNGHLDTIKMLLNKTPLPDLTIPDKTGWTPINAASDKGHFETGRLLLEAGADYEAVNESNMTSLYSAARGGHTDVFKMILKRNPRLNCQHKNGWTALCSAASSGFVEIVKLLLEKGADHSIPTSTGTTPLTTASENGYLQVVKLLVDHGADIELTNQTEMTPLYSAAYGGHPEIVRLLLKKGANYLKPNKAGWTPVCTAASNGHYKVVKLLLEQDPPVDLAATDKNGWTPLNAASDHCHFDTVKLLLKKGAGKTINIPNMNKWTPLNSVTERGSYRIAKILLESSDVKPLLEIGNSDGITPLYQAALKGKTNILKLIIAEGGDINATKDYGWTPINAAAQKGHLEAVKLLLAHGADYNTPAHNGMTPFYSACAYGHVKIAQLFLEKGVDVDLMTNDKWTPINTASQKGFIEVVRLLHAHGANINLPQEIGITPLYSASVNGHANVARFLLHKGADKNDKTETGWTPINAATRQGHVDVVKSLLKHNPDILTANQNGAAPMYWAACNGKLDLVRMFHERGADVNTLRSGSNWSSISVAGSNGHLDVVKFLYRNGADVMLANTKKRAALHTASGTEHADVVNFLIETEKADLNALDELGRTPLILAAARGNVDVVKAFTSNGALLHIKDIHGSTSLHGAVRNGHADVTEHLLSLTEPDQLIFEDGWGKNLLWWAIGSKNDRVVELVREFLTKANIQVPDGKDEHGCYPVTFDRELRWCDSCGRSIPKSDAWRTCNTCSDFDICGQCFSFGTKCTDISHEWTLHEAEPEEESGSEAKND